MSAPKRIGPLLGMAVATALGSCADPPERGVLEPGAEQPGRFETPAQAPSPGGRGAAPALPGSLERLARETGCEVPATRPGGEYGPEPWVLELPERAGHVAWCEAAAGRAGPYGLLVALGSPRHAWSACPAYVPLHEYQPLPFFELTTLPDPGLPSIRLDQYWYVTADSWREPEPVAAQGSPSGLAIHVHAGAAGNLIVCHSGRWIMTGYH